MDEKEFKLILDNSEKIYSSLNSTQDIIIEENITRRFAFHSVVSKENIFKNEKLNSKNLTTKRPGTGDYPARKIYTLFGKVAKKSIKKNTLVL